MKNVISIFFKDIPSIIFEPFAVIGVLGLITAMIIYRKERSVFYLTTFFALIFMIAWRVAIQIVSSRYAEILIFPATVAAAFFIFQLEHIRKIFPALPEKPVKLLPYLCVAVLIVVGIVKNLNYDRSTPVIDTTRMVKAKMALESVVYSADRVYWQIEYYIGQKVHFIPYIEEESNIDRCRKIIADASKKSFRSVYIFVPSSSREPEISAADVSLSGSAWTLVTKSYFNETQTKVMRVYKYSAAE